ncbi:beta-alanine transporter isoform X2 [Euwallacea similis]|uniref:beta-alanine transporter isoform X2 n=1 Tax=Euwallacea similis TaxID=1736056 RepID=UPI00344B35B6
MDFDELLPHIGEFGKYQKLVLWFVLFPAVFPCGFHAYNQLFMARVPEHWCRLPSIPNVHEEVIKNFSIPIETSLDNKSRFSDCLMYDLPYDSLGSDQLERANLTKTSLETVACRNGWTFLVEETRDSIISEWNLVCTKSFSSTLALILFGCSGLIGNYIFGYVQDGLGRKPAFFIYLIVQCLFGVATALADSFLVWVLMRVGVGFTVPAILGTPYVLAVELVGPKERTMVTVLINIAYSVSLVGLALVVYAVRSWRWMALATAAPFLALFFTWPVLPESPRWLLAQGRIAEAREILEKIASVYVGLSYYAPALGGDEYLNFFLAGAVELPTYLFLWPAMERLGRRWTLCVSMVVGGSSCLATFLVQNNYVITLALYCVGKMGISSAFVVLPLMASELYPTVVRGLGMSLSSVVGMLGPIFIPLVNYLGSDMLTLPLIVMGALLVIGGACSLLLPETLNEHLPQTLDDAEKTKLDFCACCVPPRRGESGPRKNEGRV